MKLKLLDYDEHYIDIPINVICAYTIQTFMITNKYCIGFKAEDSLVIWYNSHGGYRVDNDILKELKECNIFNKIDFGYKNGLYINKNLPIVKHINKEYEYLEFPYDVLVEKGDMRE